MLRHRTMSMLSFATSREDRNPLTRRAHSILLVSQSILRRVASSDRGIPRFVSKNRRQIARFSLAYQIARKVRAPRAAETVSRNGSCS
jgi:hypothetical protein